MAPDKKRKAARSRLERTEEEEREPIEENDDATQDQVDNQDAGRHRTTSPGTSGGDQDHGAQTVPEGTFFASRATLSSAAKARPKVQRKLENGEVNATRKATKKNAPKGNDYNELLKALQNCPDVWKSICEKTTKTVPGTSRASAGFDEEGGSETVVERDDEAVRPGVLTRSRAKLESDVLTRKRMHPEDEPDGIEAKRVDVREAQTKPEAPNSEETEEHSVADDENQTNTHQHMFTIFNPSIGSCRQVSPSFARKLLEECGYDVKEENIKLLGGVPTSAFLHRLTWKIDIAVIGEEGKDLKGRCSGPNCAEEIYKNNRHKGRIQIEDQTFITNQLDTAATMKMAVLILYAALQQRARPTATVKFNAFKILIQENEQVQEIELNDVFKDRDNLDNLYKGVSKKGHQEFKKLAKEHGIEYTRWCVQVEK